MATLSHLIQEALSDWVSYFRFIDGYFITSHLRGFVRPAELLQVHWSLKVINHYVARYVKDFLIALLFPFGRLYLSPLLYLCRIVHR